MRLGVVRGISYGLFGKPDEFGPQADAIQAGVIRAYVYWSQVEPEPGKFVWDTVDALLGQIPDGVRLWLTVCSSSPWATREKTDFLPPSPATDLGDYRRFVGRLVERCGGRVAYWQPDNEPSNSGLLWAGSAEEYVAQLKVFREEVSNPMAALGRSEDGSAGEAARGTVVLGGCGYDVFSSPEGSEQRRFFHDLARLGRDHFDLFSVNLYGDPGKVAEYVEVARDFMTRHGYDKPIVAGEYGGPVLFEFPELGEILQATFAEAFQETAATQSTQGLAERANQETPEKRAMAKLYERMPTLPPRLRMLMDGCEPELEAKRHRINSRQLVMRAVAATAAGVEIANYWNLAPEVPGYHDPLQMMHLLFGKLPLLDYDDGVLAKRYPAADTFQRLAEFLSDVDSIGAVPPYDTVRLFICRGRTPKMIAWQERDPFDGEDLPPVETVLPWVHPTVTVTDAFGRTADVTPRDGQLVLQMTDTPLFVAA